MRSASLCDNLRTNGSDFVLRVPLQAINGPRSRGA